MYSVALAAVAALLATGSTGAQDMTFMMRKGVSLTLTGANTTQQFRAGDCDVQPGKSIDAVRLKMSFALANSGGARVLTAAEKKAFLATFDCTVKYGRNAQFNPYSKVDFATLHRLTRHGLASTWEGYNDTTTGLGQSIGASTAVVLYARIPLAGFWQETQFNQLWRMGSLQAKTLTIDVRRLAAVLPSGFTLPGNVVIDIIPDEAPARYEVWTPVPRYQEWEEANRIAMTVPVGLPFLLAERTAAHASTAMTTVKLMIDQLLFYEQVTLQEVITRYNDTKVPFSAEASIADELTLLYAIPPGVRLAELPTGKPVFEQQIQSLPTMGLAWWGIDVLEESQYANEVQQLANSAGTTINVVNAATVLGLDKVLPKNLRFAMPLFIFRQREKEFETYPGMVASPNGAAVVPSVPEPVRDNARAVAARFAAAGAHAAAEDVLQSVALAIPAAGNARGLKTGSPMLERVRPAVKG